MPQKNDPSVILCGFMGCGKTSCGKILAKLTGKKFIDMDSYVEEAAGMRVSEIFSRFGEEAFRERERTAVRELAQIPGCIVASGGGALTFEGNVAAFRQAGCPIVLIDTPLPIILRRLENNTSRPLLQGPDRERRAHELYEKRLPLYRAAANIVVDGTAAPIEVARRIAHMLG